MVLKAISAASFLKDVLRLRQCLFAECRRICAVEYAYLCKNIPCFKKLGYGKSFMFLKT